MKRYSVALLTTLAIAGAQMPAASAADATGAAYVTTLPARAEVWFDATYVGRSPVYVELLSIGQHSVTVSRAGWAPEVATFSIDAGKVMTVSLILHRAAGAGSVSLQSSGQGVLSVRGSPIGATVYIDGVKAGTLPLQAKRVRAGFHIVRVKAKTSVSLAQGVMVYPDMLTVALFSATK